MVEGSEIPLKQQPEISPEDEAFNLKYKEFDIASDFYTPDHYLLDLNLFKDTRVGAFNVLISQLPEDKTEKYHKLFLSNLLKYQNRRHEELIPYVPGVPFKEEDIDNILKDESYAEDILAKSPVTAAFNTLTTLIETNINHSRPAERWKVTKERVGYIIDIDPIYFHINTYPLKLSTPLLMNMRDFFFDHYRVHVEFVFTPPKEYTQEQVMGYDEMMVRSAWDILDCEWFVQNPIITNDIHKKYLCAPGIFPRELKKIVPAKSAVPILQSSEQFLSVAIRLKWLSFRDYALDPSFYPTPQKEIKEWTIMRTGQNQHPQEQKDSSTSPSTSTKNT